MKNKDEVFNKFKEFKALIENHTEKNIKTFRSDNGRVLTSNEFKELCKGSGIKRYPLNCEKYLGIALKLIVRSTTRTPKYTPKELNKRNMICIPA